MSNNEEKTLQSGADQRVGAVGCLVRVPSFVTPILSATPCCCCVCRVLYRCILCLLDDSFELGSDFISSITDIFYLSTRVRQAA